MLPVPLSMFPLMKSLLLLLLAPALAWADTSSLQFKRIDLSDGRTLNDVTIKTYDATTGRVLLLADGTASMVPLKVFPSPLDKQISATAPRAGSSTATVTQKAPSPAVAQPTSPAPNLDRTYADAAESARAEAGVRAHAQAARMRADRYFRYEYHVGSNAVRIRSLDLDTTPPEPVSGWTGRYRTSGKAYIEFFDSVGWSYSRANSAFEVVTEEKSNGHIEVVDFTLRGLAMDR